MSSYQRTTRECTPDQLRPDLHDAIRDYFSARELGDLETASLLCCETTSTRTSTNWLSNLLNDGEETNIYSAILLTPTTLVWARAGSARPAQVTGANLMNIRAKAYVSILSQDSGLEISGIIENAKGRLRGQIALGPEPFSQKFCEEVAQAIEKINPAPARKFPSWMGGK